MRAPILLSLAVLFSVVAAHAQSNSPLRYQFPRSSAAAVARESGVILRSYTLLDRSVAGLSDLVTVTGSISGRHDGKLNVSHDGRALIFLPNDRYAAGEQVSVHVDAAIMTRLGAPDAPYTFTFDVDATTDAVITATPRGVERDRLLMADAPRNLRLAAGVLADSSEPLPDAPPFFPDFRVLSSDAPSPGRIYLGTLAYGDTTSRKPWLVMLDDSAAPTYRARRPRTTLDFKRHWNGVVTWWDDAENGWIFVDSAFNRLRHVAAKNGQLSDGHELLILPNGNVMFLTIKGRTVDMSQIVEGGDTAAVVLDMGIQEIDPEDNVVFEWRSQDHIQITDGMRLNLKAHSIDYIHSNAIHVDDDGNLLLSSRNLCEVTKIDHETGEIIWRLGGRNNQFRFTNDTVGFSNQHDARRLPNGNILLFDNGNFRPTQKSRAAEYRLDMDSMTATVEWAFEHPDTLVFSWAMGNAQRLPNGNTVIGWGTFPMVTEVRPDSTIAWELRLPTGVTTYRAYRFPAPSPDVRGMLLFPENNATSEPLSLVLGWERAGGASGYRLQVAHDPEFQSIVADDTLDAQTHVTMDGLAQRRVYYWREKPLGSEIVGVWSEVRAFMTDGEAAPQLLIAPARGTANLPMSPTLRWAPYATEAVYRLQLATDSSFDAGIIDTTISTTEFWLEGLQGSTRHYWRVQPQIFDWVGDWSEAWHFETSQDIPPVLPQEIDLLTPTRDESISRPGIEFTWRQETAPEPVLLYRMQIATDSTMRNVVFDTVLTGPSARVEGRSLAPGVYWWWVRSTDESGHQYASGVRRFEVANWLRVVAEWNGTRTARVRPNPTRGSAELELDLQHPSDILVEMMDIRGQRVVGPIRTSRPAGAQTVALPTEDLPHGIYLCTVRTNTGTRMIRVVVVE